MYCSREAIKVKVKKCESNLIPEWRKFCVDPQITTLEVLYSILAKAFDLKTDFGISYKISDSHGHELYLPVLSDYDLDAAFLRVHNQSITSSSEPCLNLRVDIKPFSEATEWDISALTSRETSPLQRAGQRYVYSVQNRLPGIIMNQMEKTLSMVQRALNLVEDPSISQPPRTPLSDTEFRSFLDSVGQIVHTKELRRVIYIAGVEPSLRRVVWKHILNVYPENFTGRERMDYMKRKSTEYFKLRDRWKTAVQNGVVVGELSYVTSMVRKDVLRTDRLHPFYAGSDDNQNIAALFNILTTYALNHPAVSYCQGMSDIASPLLVTMNDEAHAYICFCAVMMRLRTNFMLDGIAMTQKFTHLSEALQYYDPDFYEYLKLQQADDLLFCYRWLLLEMKREFAFDDSLRMLEVLWSSLPSEPPTKELLLYEKEYIPPLIDMINSPPKSPSVILRTPRENPYTKICALRRQSSALSSPIQNTKPIINKLDLTKRMNQSLDETTLIRKNKIRTVQSHQSLDETKLLILSLTEETNKTDDVDTESSLDRHHQSNILQNDLSVIDDCTTTINSSSLIFNFDNLTEEKLSNNIVATIDQSINEVAPNVELNYSNRKIEYNNVKDDETIGECVVSNNTVVETFGGGKSRISSRNRNNLTQSNSQKGIFSHHNTGNLITKPLLNNNKTGHFKDLKDKIVASKKGILTTLDKIDTIQKTDSNINNHHQQINQTTKQTKGQKVVKNFNEFLNFASINKSRISDRLTNKKLSITNDKDENNIYNKKGKQLLIKLKKSSFDDDSDSLKLTEPPPIISNYEDDENTNNKPPLQLQLKNIIIEKQQQSSFDCSSPDDSQEYFPMTTSMTRELRLELENLDRQVFGTEYHNRQQFNIFGYETPEDGVVGDSVLKTPEKYSEINYTKLNHSIDIIELGDCDFDTTTTTTAIVHEDQQKLTNINSTPIEKCLNGGGSVQYRIHHNNNRNDNSFKRISTSSANNDVFIWENPLHLNSNNSINNDIDIDNNDDNEQQQTVILQQQQQQQQLSKNMINKTVTAATPDEQLELDYDGEIIEETILGKKSVTPIKIGVNLRKQHGDCSGGGGGSVNINNRSNRNSTILLNDSDSDNTDSWNETQQQQKPYLTKSTKIDQRNEFIIDLQKNVCTNNLPYHQTTTDENESTSNILLLERHHQNMTNSCEEASEINNVIINERINDKNITEGNLPIPNFGGGNPFLMFLSLTILLQHRDYIIKSGMDYNEMAMHFDKMVRKHNVTRVLNQARRMFSNFTNNTCQIDKTTS